MSHRPVLLACLSFVAAAAVTPCRAAAHAILTGSTPQVGGRVAAGTLPITLRYNSLIDVKRSRVVLIGPGGQERRLVVAPDPGGDRMTAQTAVQPGPYLLRWQVLAIDGHITRGNVPFDVTPVTPAHAGR